MADINAVRNFIAFWIFGLCNNFAYVIMLSAADDIMSQQEHENVKSSSNSTLDSVKCVEKITSHECTTATLGAVLLADIIPCLVAKLVLPFFMHRLPHGARHLLVCILQALSYIMVATSGSIPMSLFGVVFASLSSGIGENAYLALSAHYSGNSISAWSSGTGGAGIFGALGYALLTEPHLLELTPRTTLLVMLIIPILFYITNYTILVQSPTIYRATVFRPNTWIVPATNKNTENDIEDDKETSEIKADDISITGTYEEESNTLKSNPTATISMQERLWLLIPLLKYMIPMALVYYAEYLINQGLAEPRVREYSLAVASLADAVGIVAAGFTTIPVHNFVCSLNH
ncbi:unnamed protein product [Bursaphelenchus okinawaensis]|uniref:Battenin n=1 Tax=Bursaphelenchus okinawaensis TaxID=465554 RepID=A0A811KS39_9BILA|nr:unnamed protein product [Bursaphelenchus okinawaensis]CAG9109268.1 unnamed protein product [Bursaphelenchus okinawaensis]